MVTSTDQIEAATLSTITTTAAIFLALYAETPLHPGTGQSTGVVDLPVQRERHTNFPIIPASSLKGSLREVAEQRWKKSSPIVNVLFGPEARGGNDNNLYGGALAFSDARLLAFPVRSLSQVFLWITCPLVLGRLARDLQLAGASAGLPNLSNLHPDPDQTHIIVGDDAADLPETVVLEDLSFQKQPQADWQGVATWLTALLP